MKVCRKSFGKPSSFLPAIVIRQHYELAVAEPRLTTRAQPGYPFTIDWQLERTAQPGPHVCTPPGQDQVERRQAATPRLQTASERLSDLFCITT